MKLGGRYTVCLLATTIGAACVPAGEPPAGAVASALVERGVANTITLNGIRLNGIRLNGIRLNGIRLNGPGGLGSGSILTAIDDQGNVLTGAALVGAELEGELSDGTTMPVHIDSFAQVGGLSYDDVYAYGVSYDVDGVRQPLCGIDEAGSPVEAIALDGVWDYREGVAGGGSHRADTSRFTFACRGAVLAKCTEFGYRRWATAPKCNWKGCCQSVSLAPFHQACTRMVRADYCGDGTPHTVDGHRIDIYDALGIHVEEEPKWKFEGEWDADGALCVIHARLKDGPKVPPKCRNARRLPGRCGDLDHFDQGALFMNNTGR